MALTVGFCTKRMKSAWVRRIGTRRGDPDSPVVPWQEAHLNAEINSVLPRSAFPVTFAGGSLDCPPMGVAASDIDTARTHKHIIFISVSCLATAPVTRHPREPA